MQKQERPGANMTAGQRLQALEDALMLVDKTIGESMGRLSNLSQAIRLLSEKVDAMVQASGENLQITDEVLNQIMMNNHVKELKEKTEDLKKSGILNESQEVTENSFIVFREIDSQTQKVVSARTQITARSMEQGWKDLFLGKKVGESFTRDTSLIEIEEVYEIQTLTPQAAAPAAEEAPAQEPVSN